MKHINSNLCNPYAEFSQASLRDKHERELEMVRQKTMQSYQSELQSAVSRELAAQKRTLEVKG